MDIKVLSKIRHDGKLYDHGDTIKKIKKEEGQRLINLGAAEDLDKKAESEDDKKKINEEAESEEASD